MLGIQVVLGTIWTLSLMTVERTSWANVYLFFYTYPFHLVFFLVAAWAFFRHRELRKRAAGVMLLPIGLLFLPGLIRGIAGGPVEPERALRLAFIFGFLVLAYAVIRPRRVTAWIPDFFFRSGAWNALIVLMQCLAWAMPFVAIAALASGQPSRSSGTGSGMGIAYLVVVAATYLVGLGVFSLLTSTHAWLGLRGGVDEARRGLHITQLVLGVPGILLGTAVFGWLIGQQ